MVLSSEDIDKLSVRSGHTNETVATRFAEHMNKRKRSLKTKNNRSTKLKKAEQHFMKFYPNHDKAEQGFMSSLCVQCPHAKGLVKGVKQIELRKAHIPDDKKNTPVAIIQTTTKSSIQSLLVADEFFSQYKSKEDKVIASIVGTLQFGTSFEITQANFDEVASLACLSHECLELCLRQGYRFAWPVIPGSVKEFKKPLVHDGDKCFLWDSRIGMIWTNINVHRS